MASYPDWFKPLSETERSELARLFRLATGVELRLPPPEHESPAAFLCEFDHAAGYHVRSMQATHKPQRQQPTYYDPRLFAFVDAATGKKF